MRRSSVVPCLVLLSLISLFFSGCPLLSLNLGHDAGDTIVLGGMDFVWVPDGTFSMGAPYGEPDSTWFEHPSHRVRILPGYWLGQCEVRKSEWMSVMGTAPWEGRPGASSDLDSPATHLSWDDVQAFFDVLNAEADDVLYRLPTEAEWERACRADTTSTFSYGSDEGYTQLGDYAWFSENVGKADAAVQAVGGKLPNAWGFFDMHGNAAEWCSDFFDYTYYEDGPLMNPRGPAESGVGGVDARVVRGGSFADDGPACRSAARHFEDQADRLANVGFRIVAFELLSLPILLQ